MLDNIVLKQFNNRLKAAWIKGFKRLDDAKMVRMNS